MKKAVILIIAVMSSFVMKITYLHAQHTNYDASLSISSKKPLDENKQKKVDKTRANLARAQKRLANKQSDHDKELARFEKKIAHGDLSPNEMIKWEKSLDKEGREIEHLKKKIADQEKHLAALLK